MPAKAIEAAEATEAIRGVERDRFRAMVEGDGEALDALFAENVSYVHTNGKRETKRQFIDAITAGHRRYRQIEIQSQDVLPAGRDTCLVSGRALVEMESKNGALLFPHRLYRRSCASDRRPVAIGGVSGDARAARISSHKLE
ncbi:hypothetical protein BHUM_04741c [Candidatus Burkholderia humilis]|nr:hypothetical protein BHUM_04741c [Candidatus Burkholderia humilis]